MYEDIQESLKRALVLQKWNEGDRFHRIGNPFRWLDVEVTPGWEPSSGLSIFLHYFTMQYERYPTPRSLRCADFDAVFANIRQKLSDILRLYFPFVAQRDYDIYLDAVADTRTQDYAFIRTFSDLKPQGIKHLDIGPGVGSHALYSRHGFNSLYCGLEAYHVSYQVQRDFFRCLSSPDAPYYDFVAAETFGVPDCKLARIVRATGAGVLHIPSWKFPIIDDEIFDLVTATWVLNELNHAGILWLISGSARTLKVGGYLYFRDSGKRKPGYHDVDYDALLLQLGFEEVHRLEVENRIDFLGIPRMYRKNTDTKTPSFDELVDLVLGHFGVGASTGLFNQR